MAGNDSIFAKTMPIGFGDEDWKGRRALRADLWRTCVRSSLIHDIPLTSTTPAGNPVCKVAGQPAGRVLIDLHRHPSTAGSGLSDRLTARRLR